MQMQAIALESLSAVEIQQLDLARLGDALAELMVALAECGREAISARLTLGSLRAAKSRGMLEIGLGEYGAQCEEAQTLLDTIAFRARSLRDLKSTLQTLTRATN